MRILIIEDEKKTVQYLVKGFTEHGFVADASHTGVDGLHMAETGEYQVIVLDIMLPDIDGWGIMRQLRERGNTTPVIFLTARDSVDDRVKGLELGADDYLVKPFAFSELLARVRTILRREPERQPEVLRISDMEIDLSRHKATRQGRRVDLSPKEFLILWLLARHAGEVLTRTFLSERVWDINFDSDTNVVDVAIRRLRKKVDDPFPIKLIHTVRGVGYVLEDRSGSHEI
ncbi:MAG: heavy metal response regulator transcription factor [Deltaproteobacteria bacterium]|nr:heavy metal response regulator transcription factor [Deltaproteobacteria bacterium]